MRAAFSSREEGFVALTLYYGLLDESINLCEAFNICCRLSLLSTAFPFRHNCHSITLEISSAANAAVAEIRNRQFLVYVAL